MKKQSGSILLATSLALIAWSCNQKDPEAKGDYVQGVFVVNQGNFSDNNGTISFFNREDKEAQLDVFSAANGRTISGGLTDYAEIDAKGIFLVDKDQGTDLIEIVESGTMKSVATINKDVANPQHVIKVGSNKAYVSCWGELNSDYSYKDGYILAVDLSTNTVTKTIKTGKGVGILRLINNEVYALNAEGSTVTIIDPATDAIKQSPEIGDSPVGLEADNNGKLWILCRGKYGDWSKPGDLGTQPKLVRLNAQTKAIEEKYNLGTLSASKPSLLTITSNKSTLLVGFQNNVYAFATTAASFPLTTPLIKRSGTSLTALAVDPSQGLLYIGSTPGYKQAGYIVRYRSDGNVVDSIKVGIAPKELAFK